MNIQTQNSKNNNIQDTNSLNLPLQEWSLDDEIDIFGESDWKFVDITVDDENIEYFNDVRDTSFSDTKDDMKRFMAICIFIFIFAVLTMLAIQWSGILDRKDYDRVAEIKSVANNEDNTVVATPKREQDAEIVDSSEVLLDATNSLADYFTALQSGNLETLYAYSKGSSVQKLYEERKSEIKTIYDVNDCYARIVKYLAQRTRVGRINEIRKKDDTYYIYLNISLTSDNDIDDYVYAHKKDFTKNSLSKDQNKEQVVQYMLSVLESDSIGTTSSEHCLKMQYIDGTLTVIDDVVISNAYTNVYKTLLTRIMQVVGGDLENMEY